MKRNHFQIEGDTLFGIGYNKKPCGPRQLRPVKAETSSYVSWLPLEVWALIVKLVAVDARDLQNFMRFFLPASGISLQHHLATYPVWQEQVLDLYKSILSESQPLLFKECCEDRLARLHSASIPTAYHYDGTTYQQKLASMSAILNASFAEVFAFVNHPLCESCGAKFAHKVNAIDTALQGDIPLCERCGARHNMRDPLKGKEINVKRLAVDPAYQYSWLTETKVRLFCGFKKKFDLDTFVRANAIRTKSFEHKPFPKMFYLLKDVLPHILDKFKVERTYYDGFCGTH